MHKIKTYVFAAHAHSVSRKSPQLPSARGISVVFPIIAPSLSFTSSFTLPSGGSTHGPCVIYQEAGFLFLTDGNEVYVLSVRAANDYEA